MYINFNPEVFHFLSFILIVFIFRIKSAKNIMLKNKSSKHKSTLNNTIKILCWNIAKNKKTSWQTEFVDIFSNYHPDIFIFQEVKMEDMVKNILSEKFLTWRFLPNIFHIKKQLYSGVLTASNVLPISEISHKSNSREPITSTPKATLFTIYKISNSDEKLLIINIHGINFVSLRHFRNQIQEIVEHGIQHIGPIIFSGDFNTWSKNRMKFLGKILKRKLDLIPILFEKQHKRKIKRFIFSPPLDHIFYSYKKIKLVKNSSEVLRLYKSSDHKPIFAEFRLVINKSNSC